MQVLESKWTTVGVGVIAVVALVLAFIAIQAERDLRDNWLAFQADVDVLQEDAADALRLASLELAAFSQGTLTFEAQVNETIPIDATVPFQRELIIPVQTSIPINQAIDTTIEVDGPLGLTVPVDVRVPIDLTVPIDLSIPFTIDETVDVSTTARVDIAIPIAIDVSQTDLAPLAERISEDLNELARSIEGGG